MLPFNPEMRAGQQRQGEKPTESTRPEALQACCTLRQHPARLAWRPPSLGARPGLATHPTKGPSPPKSLESPTQEGCKLRGCHQFRLPGPGFDGDFLCGGNRDACRVHNTPQAGTSRRGQEAARSQVRAWCPERSRHSSGQGEAYTEAGGLAGSRHGVRA